MRSRNKNIIITTKEYKDAKASLVKEFLPYNDSTFEECEVGITYASKQWRGDLDNACKILLDALQSSEVIRNDKLITRLVLSRAKKNEPSTVVITAIK